eukprot:4611686-Pleurochrysis_carterae.AAC.2
MQRNCDQSERAPERLMIWWALVAPRQACGCMHIVAAARSQCRVIHVAFCGSKRPSTGRRMDWKRSRVGVQGWKC